MKMFSFFRLKRGRGDPKGFTMVEVIVAMTILAIVVPAINALLNWCVIQSVNGREQTRAAHLAQMITARTRTMNFFDLVVASPTVNATLFADSSKPNFGLPNSGYPDPFLLTGNNPYSTGYRGRAQLIAMQQMVQNAGFTSFTIEVHHMLRHNNDLREFDPDSSKLRDKYDDVGYSDFNGDGDYLDVSSDTATGLIHSEQPDTRTKKISVKIYRGKEVFAHTEGELLTPEMFTGDQGSSAESKLSLSISTPTNQSFVYASTVTAQSSARSATDPYSGVAWHRTYASDAPAVYRSDPNSILYASGDTEPSATVGVHTSTSAAAYYTTTSDFGGSFTNTLRITPAGGYFAEGSNILYFHAVKSTLDSPYEPVSFIVDNHPPRIDSLAPNSITMLTLSPFIGAKVQDVQPAPGISISGLDPSVTSMQLDGTWVTHTPLDATTSFNHDGYVVYCDTTTLLPKKLTAGVHNALLEAGDAARYMVSSTWTFTIVPGAGFTPPTVSAVVLTSTQLSFILDDSVTGVDPSTLVVTRQDNAQVLLSAATPQLGKYWENDPAFSGASVNGGKVTIPLLPPLLPGTYSFRIQVSSWGGLILDTIVTPPAI